MKRVFRNESETLAFGADLYRCVDNGSLIFLSGDLGAGKTTLVRGYLRAAGYQGVVKSPTFTLVEEYRIDERKIYHFDLYRLADPEELEWMGVRDYMEEASVCFFEWPQRGAKVLPAPDVNLQLVVLNETHRLEMTGCSPCGKKIVEKLKKIA